MKKLIGTIGVVTALGIGAFSLNSVLPAGALGNAASQAPPSSSAPTEPRCGPREHFKDVLDGLVANGTITQAQEDAIIQAFKDAAEDRPHRPRPGPGPGHGFGLRERVLGGMFEVAADTIGVSVDDLKAALQAGQSVADVANEHSVSPSDVVSAIVDAGTAKVDAAVAAGKLTSEQGARIKGHLPELAERFVNHTTPEEC